MPCPARVVVLYSGNAGRVHRFEELCHAMERLDRLRPEVLFAFVGGGPRTHEIEAFVRERGLRNAEFRPGVPREELGALIDKTRFAISKEGTRYYLTGIFLHTVEATLTGVATDGHRLAKVALPAPRGAEGLDGIIIPAKTVAEIRKLAEDETPIEVGISPTKIQVAAGSVQLISKLIDGTYPDYQQVIPTGNDTTLIVDRDAFMAAVDRVSIVAADRTRAVKINVQAGAVTIQANSPESGTATEHVEGDYDGAPMEIGFNARYLIDILRELKGDTARFQLSEATKPTLVSDPTDTSALYVLMPMRV